MAVANRKEFEELLEETYAEPEKDEIEKRFSSLFEKYFLNEVEGQKSFDLEDLKDLERNPGYSIQELEAVMEAARRSYREIEKEGETTYSWRELQPEDYIQMREELRKTGELLTDTDKLRWAVPRYAFDSGIIEPGVYEQNQLQRKIGEAMDDFGEDVAPKRFSTRVSKAASILENLIDEEVDGLQIQLEEDPAEKIYRVVGLEE